MNEESQRRISSVLLAFAVISAIAAVTLFVLASQANKQAMVDDFTGTLRGMSFVDGDDARSRATLMTVGGWVTGGLTVIFGGLGMAMRPSPPPTDPERQERLDALWQQHRAGELTLDEYNAASAAIRNERQK